MMYLPPIQTQNATPVDVCGGPMRVPAPAPRRLLSVQPTPRPYPLQTFLDASPAMGGDLAGQSPGVPLTLSLRLHDGRGQAVQRAMVYVWHSDPEGWMLEDTADDLRMVAQMRGVQTSDEDGRVSFYTVYPGRFVDNSVPLYLRVYFNDGRHVLASASGCVLLPAQTDDIADALQVAPAVPSTLRKPACVSVPRSDCLSPQRLLAEPDGGGLRAELSVGIALDGSRRTH